MSAARTGSTGGGSQEGAQEGCGLWAEEGELGALYREEGLHALLDLSVGLFVSVLLIGYSPGPL